MRRTAAVLAASVLVAFFGCARPVSAQDAPKAEISGGYQSLSLQSDIDETFEKGWYADVTGNITRMFGVVFQVSGNYKTLEESATIQGVTATYTADLRLHEFMGGVRVTARPNATVAPFAQFLAGGVRGSADIEGSVTGGGEILLASSSGESSTNFGLQAGGGVNVMFTRRFGVRGAADYLRVFEEEDEDASVNAFRFAVGAVFAF